MEDGHLFLNTWYGAGDSKYKSPDADDLVTFDTLYRLFSDATSSRFDLPLRRLGGPAAFLPSVDWKAFPATVRAAERMQARRRTKRVFFDTVRCLSGQAKNFPLVPVLRNAALRRPNVTFYYTWAHPIARESLPRNAVWTRDVHGLQQGVDLNENAFISTFCDVIVGRNSSSYTFALLRENMVQRPARFLEFSHLGFPLCIGPDFLSRIKFQCTITQNRTTSREEAVAALLAEIDAV
jgi:hypothetical protein